MTQYPTVRFATELGTLALYDPEVLAHRVRAKADWWREPDTPLSDLPEVEDGEALIAPLGPDGEYAVRLSLDGALHPEEQPYARERLERLGLRVTSGRLFVGPGERLPGEGRGERLMAIPGQGAVFDVPEGHYAAEVLALDWRYDDKWFNADGEVVADAPPDFVITLRPVQEANDIDVPGVIPPLISLRARPEVKIVKASAPRLAPSARVRSRRGGARRGGSRGSAPAAAEPWKSPLQRKLEAAFLDMPELAEHLGLDFELSDPKGEVILRPGREGLQDAGWPIEELLRKVTRVREQMRVLEQKVNGHNDLSPGEQIELQAGVTEVYTALMALVSGLSV